MLLEPTVGGCRDSLSSGFGNSSGNAVVSAGGIRLTLAVRLGFGTTAVTDGD
jgi:hypothetical protein